MSKAGRVLITVPLNERARHLVSRYPQIAKDRATLKALIARLPAHIGRKQLDALHGFADQAKLVALAEALIQTHYDPAYARSASKAGLSSFTQLNLERLDTASIEQAAGGLEQLLRPRASN